MFVVRPARIVGHHERSVDDTYALAKHDNTPPETRRTFARLVALGYAPEDARRLIGNVVAQEIVAVMQRGEVYNEQRSIAALRGLPDSVV